MSKASPTTRAGQSKRIAAHSVVQQANDRAKKQKRIQALPLTRLELSTGTNGLRELHAIVPRNGGEEPYRYNLSFLIVHPGLLNVFAEAFLQWAPSCEHTTRNQQISLLRNGFFAYLRERFASDELHHDDVDDELLAGYREWLFARRMNGKPLHASTITRYLGSLKEPLAALRTGPLAAAAQAISQRVPVGPSGGARASEPTEVLPLAALLDILEACEREIREIEDRWEHGRRLLDEGTEMLRRGSVDYGNVAVCLAMLANDYKGVLPTTHEIRRMNPALGTAMAKHGSKVLSGYLYPSARDLVPFAVLLGIATVFNPETILRLRWSLVDRHADRAGTQATLIIGGKARARRELVRLIDSAASISPELSLVRVLDLLERMTSRLRKVASQNYADRMFIFVPENVSKRVAAFDGKDGRSVTISWQFGMRNFIADNNLPTFTLGQLRPTILDLVQMLDSGLEAAQAVGNHGNVVTTWKHYTSSGVKKRYRERIGEVILLRERWFDTDGKIDPRRLTPHQDRGAATPGFLCLDPFDSPAPNQRPGTLCKNYGGCPSCPLAAARPSDPVSVACYLALRRSIFASQGQMNAQTWLKRWVPNLTALNNLLDHVAEAVLTESRKISISLPAVG